MRKFDGELNIPSLLEDLCQINSVFGLSFLVSFFIGCITSVNHNKTLILIYFSWNLSKVLLQIVLFFLWILGKEKFNSQLGDFLEESLQTNYIGSSVDSSGNLLWSRDRVTRAWDIMQTSMKCCGSNSHTQDFGYALKYRRKQNIITQGEKRVIQATVPITCCRPEAKKDMRSDTPKIKYNISKVLECLMTPSESNSYTERNCNKIISKKLKWINLSMLIIGIINFSLCLTNSFVCINLIQKMKEEIEDQHILAKELLDVDKRIDIDW